VTVADRLNVTDPLSLMAALCGSPDLPKTAWLTVLVEAAARKLAIASPLTPEKLAEEAAGGAGEAGSVAGEMLLFLLSASEHHPKHASVRRAVAVRQWDAGQGQKNHAGQPVNYSERFMWNSWKRFRSTSHLRAAWDLLVDGELDGEAIMLGGGWKVAVANAEWLRAQAASRRLRNGELILAAADLAELDLPPDLPAPRLRIPPLPAAALDFLEVYTVHNGAPPSPA
jgi:hypothetical protein